MEDKQQFYRLLKPLRRQLFFKRMMEEIQYWILAAAAFAVMILFTARVFVIPYYHEFVWFGCFLLLLVIILRIWRNRPGWRETAELFNAYVPEDRVITAHSFLDEEGMLQKLQLAETLTYMKREIQRVMARKKGYFLPKWLGVAAVFVCIAAILNYFPNQTLQLAAKKETEMKVLKRVEKKLEERVKKEKNTEIKKVLEKVQETITKNPDPIKALEKLANQKKELDLKALKEQEKQENFKAWQQELKNNDLNKLAGASEKKDLEKIKKELEQLNKKYDSLTEGQKKALSMLSGTDKKLSEKDLAKLAKAISEALKSDTLQKELAEAKAVLGEAADSLQKEMAANGLQPSPQVALNQSNQPPGNKTNSQSNKNKNPASGTNGSSQGSQASGTGSRAGNGNGSGNGNGNGTGSGNGSGSGTGAGSGGGAGLSAGSRQFLTIPEKLAGKNNLESDSGAIGKGSPSEQFEGNGPILKGQIRSYQEFYGAYSDAYRKSTDRVKLPSDLEEIVKNYFLKLNPNKE